MTSAEARRRQMHYHAHRRRWRKAHPIAQAEAGRAPVVKRETFAETLQHDEVLAEIVAAYRDDPVTGWGRR